MGLNPNINRGTNAMGQTSLIRKTVSKQIIWLVMPQQNRDLSEKNRPFWKKKDVYQVLS
jgi:hypothetical protein